MNHTIVALYDDISDARMAVEALRDRGVPTSDISLVANDVDSRYHNHLTKTTKDTGDSGAAAGAGIGAALGGIGGLLVGIGALAIPGIGPVLAAGPLATALAGLVGAGVGAVAGGVTGGLIGALVDLGIPEEQAQYYTEGVRRGGALVTATVSDANVNEARAVLNQYNPVDINTRAAAWRQTGWTGHDSGAKPYTSQQTMEERERYRTGM